jgi:hypothetical protein
VDYSKNVVTNGTSCCTISPSVSPTPSVTPSKTPSVTPSISISVTPSVTPTISITPSLTPSLTPTPTPSVSDYCPGNLLTNGQFTSNLNGWDSGSTANSSVSWVNYNGSGQAIFAGSGSSTLSQDILSVGFYYNVTFDVTSTISEHTASLYVYLGTNVEGPIPAYGSQTTYNFNMESAGNTTFALTVIGDNEKVQPYFIDNVCVQDIS